MFGMDDASPMPMTLRLRFRVQARGPSSVLTFPIDLCGSQHQRPLQDCPPTLQAFQSLLSKTPLVSPRRLFMAPFRTPVATGFNSEEQLKYIKFLLADAIEIPTHKSTVDLCVGMLDGQKEGRPRERSVILTPEPLARRDFRLI